MKKVLEVAGEAEQVLLQVLDGALAHMKFTGGGHAMVNKLLSFIKEVPADEKPKDPQ